MRASASPRRCSTDYSRQYGVVAKIARIFNTYGPRMQPDDGRVVSNFIVQALRGEDLTVYGEGSQTRSFCYVDDLVRGIVRLMDSPDDVNTPINLGNPDEHPVAQLADTIIRMTGSRSDIVYRPLPVDDPTRRRPDISKARELLGWSPAIELEQGLRRTINHFKSIMKGDRAPKFRVVHQSGGNRGTISCAASPALA